MGIIFTVWIVLNIAYIIANEQEKQLKKIKVFLQVNVAGDQQKNGIELNNVSSLLDECIIKYKRINVFTTHR